MSIYCWDLTKKSDCILPGKFRSSNLEMAKMSKIVTFRHVECPNSVGTHSVTLKLGSTCLPSPSKNLIGWLRTEVPILCGLPELAGVATEGKRVKGKSQILKELQYQESPDRQVKKGLNWHQKSRISGRIPNSAG